MSGKTAEPIAQALLGAPIRALLMGAGGERLFVGGDDGIVRVFDTSVFGAFGDGSIGGVPVFSRSKRSPNTTSEDDVDEDALRAAKPSGITYLPQLVALANIAAFDHGAQVT